MHVESGFERKTQQEENPNEYLVYISLPKMFILTAMWRINWREGGVVEERVLWPEIGLKHFSVGSKQILEQAC